MHRRTAARPDTTLRRRGKECILGMAAAACAVFVGTAGAATAAQASADPALDHVIRAAWVQEAPVLDGRLDEPIWLDAPTAVDFTQSEPREGQRLTERTVVRVLFDREYLYLGVYCYDSKPSGILINELKRDFDSREGDAFGVALEPRHGSRSSFTFFTNPGSAKRDAQGFDDGRYVNLQWDGVWHVASAVHGDGWVSEMAIPFKTLGLKTQTIESMGINFKRRIRRNNEEGYWAPVPRRFTINYVSYAGMLTGLGPISGGTALQVKPFATADLRTGDAAWTGKAKAGIDAKYRLSTGVALDVTYNTDFSHVEADTQQVNLTRFSPFFPEKRDFFLENADIFAFGDAPGDRTGRNQETQLFYTRRIGLSANGEPVPLHGGARLSGRAGAWSVGLLGIRQGDSHGAPANTYSVMRVRRDLFAGSDAGVIVISRDGAADFNRSYGADVNLRAGANWTANAFWAATAGPGLSGDNDQKKVSSQWDNGVTNVQVVVADIGSNFRPEVGFVPRTGVRSYQGTVGRVWRPSGRPLIREWDTHAKMIYVTDRENLTLTKDEHYALALNFRDGSRIKISHNPQFERLVAPFDIRGGIGIAAGDYPYDELQVSYNSDRSKLLGTTINLTRGGFYDGDRTSASVAARLLVKPRLTATLSYEHNAVDLPAGSFRADLYILRGLYSVSPRLFVDALVQYNTETERVFTTARLNFTYRPLSDLSIVFNENRLTAARLLPQPARALMFKYTRLLQF